MARVRAQCQADPPSRMLTVVDEAQRFLAVVDAIREEGSPDFLRYGSSRDKARETRTDTRKLADRIADYSILGIPPNVSSL